MARILLVQPPFTQLNSPYPAISYLKAFLEREGHECRARDLALETSRAIFSRDGLEKAFAAAEAALTPEMLEAQDDATASNLIRYLSNRDAYLDCVDPLMGFLSGGNEDFALRALEPGRLPGGHHSESYLEETEGPADPRILGTKILEDLADFISFVLDPDFSLIRYGETKAASQPRFSEVWETARGSWVIETFVRPLARALLSEKPADLLCLSVPFPGCLAPALALCEEAHALGIQTALGGGYPSTELRFATAPAFFGLVDYLVLDSGYGALSSIAEILDGKRDPALPLRRVLRLLPGESAVSAEGFEPEREPDYPAPDFSFRPLPGEEEARLAAAEREALRTVAPDYADVDWSLYLRLKDDENPMHALWSSGKWLKARLAWGCYWARCSFCDGELDYIGSYAAADVPSLYESLRGRAAAAGLSGVHLVDEAAPVPGLLSFAAENLAAGRPLAFWGNTRFEPLFTRDRADFLSHSGFIAASAGIEVATEAGLGLSNKGLTLAQIVSSTDALSRAGILVHAYLMHGLPGQDVEDLVDSLEVLRQMFRLGLLHSAFWHPFVLTRHSPLYRERFAGAVALPRGDFGLNDLDWPGSGKLSAYAEGLEAALASYMEGEGLEEAVETWFDQAIPQPRVAPGLVKELRSQGRKAQAALAEGPAAASRAVWLGGRVVRAGGKKASERRIAWSWKNGLNELGSKGLDVDRLASLLEGAAPAATRRRAAGSSALSAYPSARELRAELLECLGGDGEALRALKDGGLLFV